MEHAYVSIVSPQNCGPQNPNLSQDGRRPMWSWGECIEATHHRYTPMPWMTGGLQRDLRLGSVLGSGLGLGLQLGNVLVFRMALALALGYRGILPYIQAVTARKISETA